MTGRLHHLLLADDHAMVREYVRSIVSSQPELNVVGEVADGFALLQMVEDARDHPDLVIVDITMPGMHGIEAARRIKALHPEVKIIILTIHKEREYLAEALSAGVEGYVLKGSVNVELLPAISEVLAGGTYISSALRHE
jgi:two-component system response regulator NreC